MAIRRNRVSLAIVFHLQPVFDIAQKAISISKGTRIFSRKQFVLDQLFEGGQRLRALKKGLASGGGTMGGPGPKTLFAGPPPHPTSLWFGFRPPGPPISPPPDAS